MIVAIVKNPNQLVYGSILVNSFSGAGEDAPPAPRIVMLFASLRYAAVKVPRGGSPGSRMLDFLEVTYAQ